MANILLILRTEILSSNLFLVLKCNVEEVTQDIRRPAGKAPEVFRKCNGATFVKTPITLMVPLKIRVASSVFELFINKIMRTFEFVKTINQFCSRKNARKIIGEDLCSQKSFPNQKHQTNETRVFGEMKSSKCEFSCKLYTKREFLEFSRILNNAQNSQGIL